MTRLVVAGRAWDDVTNAFTGGRVVRLEANGSWTELFTTAAAGCSRLKEFIIDGLPYLFFIESPGTGHLPQRGTLWRSADEGDTWTDVSPGGAGEYTMSYSLGAGGRIWAITDERQDPNTVVGGPSRIYYTDDKGTSWTLSHTIAEVSFGTRKWPAYNIAAHPTDANLVVVEGVEMVAWDVRMWRTSNGGGIWTAAFDPVFGLGVDVDNTSRAFARQLDYAADGTLVYITRATTGSATTYIFRSSNNGSNWAVWASAGGFSANDGSFFLEGCGGLWFVSEARVWQADDFTDTPPTQVASRTTPPFASDIFMGISCADGVTLDLASWHAVPNPVCCGPPGLWQRPINLSTGWVEHPQWASMDSALGYRVYPWVWGVVGATAIVVPPDRYELPCEDAAAAGDFVPQCIPILNWQISVDGQRAYFSRSRAQGMGLSNAGQDHAARVPNEGTWAPSGGDYGKEGGSYNIRREIIINDYGINQAAELDNLATAYLPLDTKQYGGITTIKFQVGGMPRAGSLAPVPNKILQAGDRIQFGCNSGFGCGIAEGDWIVDEALYEFPEGITTIIASKRPAAQTRPMDFGNIRNIGESLAQVGGVYESPWFSVNDAAFAVNPDLADPSKFYDTFQFQHYLGVMPRTITMIAAKQKIFDWYDDAAVIAAQPLYVPRSFVDLSQVQGVGYNILDVGAAADNKIAFFFWRYLFYDDLDGEWVRPQDRFIKVWVMA